MEFSVLPLTSIRKFHLVHSGSSEMFHPLSFPALETLIITGSYNTNLSRLFSVLFSNPSLSPSLKTLEFLDCILTEEFMEELKRFASERKNTTSVRLHRVVIIHQDGNLLSTNLIHGLGEHIPVVEAGVEWVVSGDLV